MTFSFCLVLFASLLAAASPAAFGQVGDPTPPAPPPPIPGSNPRATPAKPVYRPVPAPAKPGMHGIPAAAIPAATPERPDAKNARKVRNPSDGPAEKIIEVDQKVNITLCVEGRLKVNGWDRSEIRAYVDGGSSVGFRVLQLNKAGKKVAAVQALGFDPQVDKEMNLDECLEGDNIELDVPFDTVLNIRSIRSEMSIDSVSRVRIDNNSGSINLSNISVSSQATTFQGDITLENAKGPVNLMTTAGKIIVFGASPNDIGEIFRAKSRSGAIALQDVEHTDVDISSTTGSIRFNGDLETGGRYNFNTTSGSIVLLLPVDTSCKVVATYGGAFETQIPFKEIQKNVGSTVQKVIALLGGGESVVNVTTFNGSILIKPNKK